MVSTYLVVMPTAMKTPCVRPNYTIVTGSVPDWEQLFRKAYKHLKPGGWLEDVEMAIRIQSDHVDFPEHHILNEMAKFYYKDFEKMGRTFGITCGHRLKNAMEAAGFVDVTEIKFKTPCHAWPRDPSLKQAGLLLKIKWVKQIEVFVTTIRTDLEKLVSKVRIRC